MIHSMPTAQICTFGIMDVAEPYIFIAHKSDDKPRIRPIAEWLLERDFSIWIDNPEYFRPALRHRKLQRLQSGENFRRRIPELIDGAACVLVIWSRTSVDSPLVREEADRALAQKKLLPLRIDPVDLPFGFRELKTIDMIDDLSKFSAGKPQKLDLETVGQDIMTIITAAQMPADPYSYEELFSLEGYRIPFVPLLNPKGQITLGRKRQLAKKFTARAASIIRDPSKYDLPRKFQSTRISPPPRDLPSCRLVQCSLTEFAKIEFTFSEILYSDYLKSGEHLDDLLPDDPTRTFRQAFARLLPRLNFNLSAFPLTNICGVGLFVITRDRKVLICRHSADSHVYPLRWTFSASGTMRWGACPNPFTEVIHKCLHEIGHQINLSTLELIEVGVDTRKLFFECCFFEHTELDSKELAETLPKSLKYEMIPVTFLSGLVHTILERCWEPAAEAALLMLAIKENGLAATLGALRERKDGWKRHEMLDEWDHRASRHHSLAVMSTRYPRRRLETASARYVDKVMRFMGEDIRQKRVLEIGSGIGRITKRLCKVCKHITCIDLCERMHQRNREKLGQAKRKVTLKQGFVQEFKKERKQTYDVAICSLVLIHNVDTVDFKSAIAVACESADVVFVFEDVSQRPTGSQTRIISRECLIDEFSWLEFVVERQDRYSLFRDEISLLKFVRAEA